jgi:DNA (cytosine-5)-methyltransferase 1
MAKYLIHGNDFVFPDVCKHASGQEGNVMRYRYKVIGNAVPPPLFEAVANALPDIWE